MRCGGERGDAYQKVGLSSERPGFRIRRRFLFGDDRVARMGQYPGVAGTLPEASRDCHQSEIGYLAHTLLHDLYVREILLIELEFSRSGGERVRLQEVRQDVEFDVVGDCFRICRRHGVPELREERIDAGIEPVRRESVAAQSGRAYGAVEGAAVAVAA